MIFDLNAGLLNKYDRVLNNNIRFIISVNMIIYSTYWNELKWLPIRQRRQMRVLTTLFSILLPPHQIIYLPIFDTYAQDTTNQYVVLKMFFCYNQLILLDLFISFILYNPFYYKDKTRIFDRLSGLLGRDFHRHLVRLRTPVHEDLNIYT